MVNKTPVYVILVLNKRHKTCLKVGLLSKLVAKKQIQNFRLNKNKFLYYQKHLDKIKFHKIVNYSYIGSDWYILYL